LTGGQEVAGSNPVSPISLRKFGYLQEYPFFFEKSDKISTPESECDYLATVASAVENPDSIVELLPRDEGIPHMTRKKNAGPSYLLHKSSGQVRIRINRHDYLLS
jgi:hypothetical protein